tara:strand:+ start:48639 stop:49157 length:519 start_codon:yes stop_codon:yes gene_type:complete
MKFFSKLLLLAVSILAISSCANGPKVSPPPGGSPVGENPTDGPGVTPGSFLYTGYEPLEKWMDERFKVRYENMPLKMVFDQQPISDIRYDFVNLPENTPVFQLISPSISRREILGEISRFFDLTMQVDMVNGKPNAVIVRGKGRAVSSGSPYAPTFSSPGEPRIEPAVSDGF